MSATHEALHALAAELERPIGRFSRWLTDLVSLRIDWRSFGRTRGGFFGPFGMPLEYIEWPGGLPPVEPEAFTVSGGMCLPIGTYAFGENGWDPWRLWYCAHAWRLMDALPPLGVQRGGIRYTP